MSKRHRTARNASPTPREVYGEEVSGILDLLSELWGSAVATDDGLCTVNLSATHERFEPFLRALLRAEAELLLADAGRADLTVRMLRSPANRSHDALVLVAWRALAAVGAPNCEGPIQAVLHDLSGTSFVI